MIVELILAAFRRSPGSTTDKQFRFRGRCGPRRYGYGCGRYQHRMADHADGHECVTSNGSREGYCPHQAEGLQNIMPDSDIGNVTKRTNFMVEHKVPAVHHKQSNFSYHARPSPLSRCRYTFKRVVWIRPWKWSAASRPDQPEAATLQRRSDDKQASLQVFV